MPTYPTVIDASESISLIPYKARPHYRLGGIYQATMHYNGGNEYIKVLKSLDDGDTWSELDSGNRPQISGVVEYISVGYCATATDMWFAYCSTAGSPPSSTIVNNFNFSTGTWGTPITGGPAPKDAVGGTSVFTMAQLGIAVRSNGDIVLVHSYKNVFIGTRHGQLFSVYTGSSWTVNSQDLLISYNQEGNAELYNYELVGVVIDENDIVHVHGSSDNGNVYIAILTDNTRANYRRFDDDNRVSHQGDGPRGGSVWGNPLLLTVCETTPFSAIPFGAWTASIGTNNTWRPGTLMVPASSAPTGHAFQQINETFEHEGNWSSIAASQDPSTGSLYIVWANSEPGVGDADIRMACWNGLEWSAPSTIFSTDYATYDQIEEIEIEVLDGVLRLIFASPFGTWYWQGDVTCTASSCSAGATVGNINAARA